MAKKAVATLHEGSKEGRSYTKEDEVFNIRQFCYIFAENAKIGCTSA